MKTIAEVKKAVKELGLVCSYDSEVKEFRINFINGKEATAYYTNNRQDAIDSAKAMLEQKIKIDNKEYPAKSLADLNKNFQHKLVRGREGYYYWPDAICCAEGESVYVYNQNHMTINRWIAEYNKRFDSKGEIIR